MVESKYFVDVTDPNSRKYTDLEGTDDYVDDVSEFGFGDNQTKTPQWIEVDPKLLEKDNLTQENGRFFNYDKKNSTDDVVYNYQVNTLNPNAAKSKNKGDVLGTFNYPREYFILSVYQNKERVDYDQNEKDLRHYEKGLTDEGTLYYNTNEGILKRLTDFFKNPLKNSFLNFQVREGEDGGQLIWEDKKSIDLATGRKSLSGAASLYNRDHYDKMAKVWNQVPYTGGVLGEWVFRPVMEANLAKATVDGALSIARGIAKLPFDLNILMNSEESAKMSKWLGNSIPELGKDTALEKMFSIGIQYGLGTKKIHRLLSEAMKGKPRFQKWLAMTMAQWSKDYVVTTGNELSISNELKHYLPFNPLSFDSGTTPNHAKRAFIATEGVLAASAMRRIWDLTKATGRGLKRGKDWIWGSDKASKSEGRRLAEELLDESLTTKSTDKLLSLDEKDVARATLGSQQPLGPLTKEGKFKIDMSASDPVWTTPFFRRIAQLVQEPDVLKVENFLRADKGPIGKQLADWYETTRLNLAKYYKKTLDGSDLGNAKFLEIEETLSTGAQKQVTNYQRALEKADDEMKLAMSEALDQYSDQFSLLAKNSNEAIERMDLGLLQRLSESNLRKNALYEAIDTEGIIKTSKTTYDNWVKESFEVVSDPAIGKEIKNFYNEVAYNQIINPPDYTLKTLINNKKWIETGIEHFYSLSTPVGTVTAKHLKTYRRYLEDQIDALSKSDNPTYRQSAEIAKKAKEEYKKSYLLTFGKGGGKLFKERAYKDAELYGAQRTRDLIYSNKDANLNLSAKRLKDIVDMPVSKSTVETFEEQGKSFVTREEMYQSIEDIIFNDVKDMMLKIGKNSEVMVDARRLEAYINQPQISVVLDKFQTIGKKLDDMLDYAKNKRGKIDELTSRIKDKKEELKVQLNEAKQSAKFYVSHDLEHVTDEIMKSDNPLKTAKQIFTFANKVDPSGKSWEGIKQTFQKRFKAKVNSNYAVGGNTDYMEAGIKELSDLLDDTSTLRAFQYMYGNGNIHRGKIFTKTLRKFRDEMVNFQRASGREFGKVGTEKTGKGLPEKARLFAASVWGIVKGQGIYYISDLIYSGLNLRGINPRVIAKEILSDAMSGSNLKLLQSLLTKDVSNSIAARKARSYLTGYLQSKVIPTIIRESGKVPEDENPNDMQNNMDDFRGVSRRNPPTPKLGSAMLGMQKRMFGM